MKKLPLVSIVVPTRNSAEFLAVCLESVRAQSYANIELIVVDRDSSDNTKEIARAYTDHVYNYGPERSAQRNFGVTQSKGEYLLIIDSDMKLDTHVVEECVEYFKHHSKAVALVIPEESYGEGFWAHCKQLERSFYVGVHWMEAARAFQRDAYIMAGGYDEHMVSGEDWDLSQRVELQGDIGRIQAFIFHNEGKLKLMRTLRKKYYYAQKISAYVAKESNAKSLDSQTNIFARYGLLLSRPGQLLAHPFLGIGMLFMKTCEFACGAFGLLSARLKGAGK